ncbi:MAG: DedA family protein [Gammaproteobacteria bacterium]|nr:DedA family protein [Gammaproteobacteria bacterium]MBT8134289.1 DedA family protein [Gammaproteobacteria bacterium]NNJ49231.1 DedA family protein [Gammaproteobacteria bacterium]
MMIFAGLYNRVMRWAAHPHAERYLVGVSIFESIFFPIPTALMVAPMAVAKPDKAVRIALIATSMSVLGGVFGYYLGYFAISAIEPVLHDVGYWDKYMTAHRWFEEWGFWAVVVAGFSPIPFKLFTISAGALSMALLPFVLAAIVGRSAHFFLVSLLMAWAGPKMEPVVKKYIEWLGWATVVLIGVFIYFH